MKKISAAILIQGIRLSKVFKSMKLLHWNLQGTDSVSAEGKKQFGKGPLIAQLFLTDSSSDYSTFHNKLMT